MIDYRNYGKVVGWLGGQNEGVGIGQGHNYKGKMFWIPKRKDQGLTMMTGCRRKPSFLTSDKWTQKDKTTLSRTIHFFCLTDLSVTIVAPNDPCSMAMLLCWNQEPSNPDVSSVIT